MLDGVPEDNDNDLFIIIIIIIIVVIVIVIVIIILIITILVIIFVIVIALRPPEGIRLITMDNPPVNSLTHRLSCDFSDCLSSCAHDPSVKVLHVQLERERD